MPVRKRNGSERLNHHPSCIGQLKKKNFIHATTRFIVLFTDVGRGRCWSVREQRKPRKPRTKRIQRGRKGGRRDGGREGFFRGRGT